MDYNVKCQPCIHAVGEDGAGVVGDELLLPVGRGPVAGEGRRIPCKYTFNYHRSPLGGLNTLPLP